ncbi:cysteine--tRNA ligase [Mesobaculum littorinae]|uniref:Cysteine--tRNA ligase n=1 Tax=Mesobaculum littorinae TaxID=2486419 RepID=A0A438AMG4_9RHOB|nr:cysteine--tRNA ligase [Mesobaculum littorinae]RVV99872.1 cysteine--tRNA ligase [Mesobaculum littorinae]
MTEIRLYNTAAREKQVFHPLTPGDVRIYVCGPTVYDRAHLGNARPVIVFDLLYRLLRHVHGAEAVTYARNFTDVDDRINETAQKRRAAGAPGTLEDLIRDRSDETIGWYHDDMDALGALRPDHEPRATEYIGAMVAMIADLVDRGHAYVAEGHVLFAVESYKDYGRLSGRTVEDMIAGARVEVAPYKRNPMDFVLWKPSDDELPGWDSPWGRGRPGWHIECSAMSAELLGQSFDIHGGGIDLAFPHHENEIAQSCCAHPEGHFAQIWMHNEMLMVEGRKMSKSLGNFFTVRDLLDQGIRGEVIRYVFLSTHYRKPMDWTAEKAAEAEAVLRKWYEAVDGVAAEIPQEVVVPLADDLNGHGALTAMHALYRDGRFAHLAGAMQLLGLLGAAVPDWAGTQVDLAVSDLIETLLAERAEARKARDFARADALRDGFAAAGVVVKDTAGGAEWELAPGFDRAALEALR